MERALSTAVVRARTGWQTAASPSARPRADRHVETETVVGAQVPPAGRRRREDCM